MIRSFPSKVVDYSLERKDLFFVQVGANDGKRADPIFNLVKRYHWRGILVEPIREFYDQLKSNYKAENQLIYEQIAISTENEIEIFTIKSGAPKLISFFGKTLSSTSREILEKNLWFLPGFKKYITKQRIDCLTLSKLLKKNKTKSIDLLLIDTEGYDFEVLKQINELNSLPKFIYFEHKHLKKVDKKSAWKMLNDLKYIVEKDIWNTFAYRA